jgi:hypothetical protein
MAGRVGLIGIMMSEADRSAFTRENDGGTGDTLQSFLPGPVTNCLRLGHHGVAMMSMWSTPLRE